MGYEYEVHDGDEYFATDWSATDSDAAYHEAMHYAMQCDDPTVYQVTRTLIARPNA